MLHSRRRARHQFWAAMVVVATIALFSGLWTHHQNKGQSHNIELESGTLLPAPEELSPFDLVDLENKPFTKQNLKGKWSVLFFGFTQCPMLCPTTLSMLNKMYNKLAASHIKPMPQVVFISVDPDRDSTKSIADYLGSFNKHFVGATGSKVELTKLAKHLNILFMKVAKKNAKDANDYVIDHSGTLLLVNPDAKLTAVFSTPHDAIKLSHDLQTIEGNYHV